MKRKALSLLVVAAMAVTMLAGCGGSDKSADKGDGSKKELNILMEQVPDTDYVLELLDKYEEETGVKVNVEAVNYEIMHEKLMTQLTAKESNYDVLVVDNYWVGEFVEAGWMEDLSSYIKDSGFDTTKYVKSMWEMVGEVDGTPYMIPFYNYMFSLIYRTDIFADKDLQAKYKEETGKELKMPCDTLDEYVEIAKFVTKEKGPDLCGTVNQAKRGDPISMEFCSFLYSCGGYFYDDDGNITINDKNAVHALELYCDSVKNASTKGAEGFALDESYNVYSQGGAASYITHNWMLPKIEKEAVDEVKGNSALANIPGGHAQNGGWGWAIPSNATDKQASWDFISWIESFDNCKARALAGGSPTRTDVFEDPDVLAKYPQNKTVLEVMEGAKMVPIMVDAPQLIEVFGRELSLAVSGEKKPKDALDTVAKEMKNMK